MDNNTHGYTHTHEKWKFNHWVCSLKPSLLTLETPISLFPYHFLRHLLLAYKMPREEDGGGTWRPDSTQAEPLLPDPPGSLSHASWVLTESGANAAPRGHCRGIQKGGGFHLRNIGRIHSKVFIFLPFCPQTPADWAHWKEKDQTGVQMGCFGMLLFSMVLKQWCLTFPERVEGTLLTQLIFYLVLIFNPFWLGNCTSQIKIMYIPWCHQELDLF